MTTSFFELLDKERKPRKQRFVDWFTGTDVADAWNEVDFNCTFSMNDSINGGFNLLTGTGNFDN